MLENIFLILFGFIAGIVFTFIVLPSEKEEIKMIDPPPMIREEKKPIFVWVEHEIPDEDMLYPVSEKYVESQLQNKLAEGIWRYAIVTREYNKRDMIHRFRVSLQVIDNGHMNPFTWRKERQ